MAECRVVIERPGDALRRLNAGEADDQVVAAELLGRSILVPRKSAVADLLTS
jgi:hypothetical protein